MYLAPLNYDRFFRRVFSHLHIAKAFLEDFLDVKIEEIELLENKHFLTNDSSKVEFDFRCKINGADIIIDMQQWYKPDVVKRFYLYHCASTVLQLERLPEKKILIEKEARAKDKDYKFVSPVLTLIWMVQDTFELTQNFVTFGMTPQEVQDFLRDNILWENPNIQELIQKRNEVLALMQHKNKELDFLAQNQLTFMFQPNIINDKKFSKYHQWFVFAEKTRNKKNKKSDFQAFESQELFKDIIFLINKKKLTKEDLNYIETEDEHIALVKRALQDEFDNGFDMGFEKGEVAGFEKGEVAGFEKGEVAGFEKGKIEIILSSYEAGADIAFIAKITKQRESEVMEILKKNKLIQ